MRRRVFVAASTVVGLALEAHAQPSSPPSSMTQIGLLHSASPGPLANVIAGFRQGLAEAGFVEGRNLAIEYRWAEGQYDRLPALAADLVGRRVAAIFAAGGTAPAMAAKAATAAIPIVFVSAADPLQLGLVASLGRPGANVTGVSLISAALEAKRLDLLCQLVPGPASIGTLINPKYPDAALQRQAFAEAAGVLKRQIRVVEASTEREIDEAFVTLVQGGVGGLLIAQDPFLDGHRDQLVALSLRHSLPTIYVQREFAVVGGLMSYGPNFADGYRQGGAYIGRILKGEKPANLPVVQPTKFEFVVNLKTAKALGLVVPPVLLAATDDVIE
jgi:putative ABC transport system substrate-binding protein